MPFHRPPQWRTKLQRSLLWIRWRISKSSGKKTTPGRAFSPRIVQSVVEMAVRIDPVDDMTRVALDLDRPLEEAIETDLDLDPPLIETGGEKETMDPWTVETEVIVRGIAIVVVALGGDAVLHQPTDLQGGLGVAALLRDQGGNIHVDLRLQRDAGAAVVQVLQDAHPPSHDMLEAIPSYLGCSLETRTNKTKYKVSTVFFISPHSLSLWTLCRRF